MEGAWKVPSQVQTSEESARLREANLICVSFPKGPVSTASEGYAQQGLQPKACILYQVAHSTQRVRLLYHLSILLHFPSLTLGHASGVGLALSRQSGYQHCSFSLCWPEI